MDGWMEVVVVVEDIPNEGRERTKVSREGLKA